MGGGGGGGGGGSRLVSSGTVWVENNILLLRFDWVEFFFSLSVHTHTKKKLEELKTAVGTLFTHNLS